MKQAVRTNIDQQTRAIRAQMAALGRCLDDGDLSEWVVWVIPGALGCVHRPLRHHPVFGRDKKGRYLPPEASDQVLQWIGRLKQLGIASIISLMHPNELKHYAQLDLGAKDLLEAYRSAGFEVRHIPWDDPAHRPGLTNATFSEELERVRGGRTEAVRRASEASGFALQRWNRSIVAGRGVHRWCSRHSPGRLTRVAPGGRSCAAASEHHPLGNASIEESEHANLSWESRGNLLQHWVLVELLGCIREGGIGSCASSMPTRCRRLLLGAKERRRIKPHTSSIMCGPARSLQFGFRAGLADSQ
jgi:hypothetical protein